MSIMNQFPFLFPADLVDHRQFIHTRQNKVEIRARRNSTVYQLANLFLAETAEVMCKASRSDLLNLVQFGIKIRCFFPFNQSPINYSQVNHNS
ncbi:hypothetical protein SAMN04488034_101478 [Salinimicrobium catena]|uniref:Uncharacterized protein n=1 Tax=Salinimicrobium catena TaxID=390640 RepID=A0A1H5IQ81_9FLAO|nr:hypothetical protein SAMN04488034_101478 [Salinimicrobium catena]